MKIEFENFKTKVYEQSKDETYGIFFRSTEAVSQSVPTTICLYDTDPYKDFESEKIYLELANASAPDKALEFCNKYGKLIETDTLMEVYIEIENQDFKSTNYDYILYDHFKYYQLTISNLAKLFLLLQKETLSKEKASKNPLTEKEIACLFAHCCHLIMNPYHRDRFQLELSDFFDALETLNSLKGYPLVQYIFLIMTDPGKKLQANKDFRLPLPKPAFTLVNFFITTMRCFTDRDVPYIPHDYIVNHRSEFIQLANYVYTQILSFEIRFTHPEINLESFDNISCWEFHSLSNAIFFYFYIDNSRGNIFNICANEYCKKFYSWSTRPDKMYCSRNCAQKVSKRKYKNKNKID